MRQYCTYCGRVAHRCECAAVDSRLRRFLARAGLDYVPSLMDAPYKRGVPPQIKRRERATLRRNRQVWYAELVARDGEQCAHCVSPDDLVLDHVQSVAKGGQSTPENLQLLCAGCNTAKGKLVYNCQATTADG